MIFTNKPTRLYRGDTCPNVRAYPTSHILSVLALCFLASAADARKAEKNRAEAQAVEYKLRSEYGSWLDDKALQLRIASLDLFLPSASAVERVLHRFEECISANLYRLNTIGSETPPTGGVQTEWNELRHALRPLRDLLDGSSLPAFLQDKEVARQVRVQPRLDNESQMLRCPACGETYGIGMHPFCPHGSCTITLTGRVRRHA